MFRIVLVLAITLCFSQNGKTAECYDCQAFGQDDPSACQNIDDEKTTKKCGTKDKYCLALRSDFVAEDGRMKYTNIRSCLSNRNFCPYSISLLGDKIKICQVCETDKCNNAPLVLSSEATPEDASEKGKILECYDCQAFKKDDPSECQNIDKETKTIKCGADDKYCVAIRHDFVEEDGKTIYTNIRGCLDDKDFCSNSVSSLGDEIKKCQICETDKCNRAPLV